MKALRYTLLFIAVCLLVALPFVFWGEQFEKLFSPERTAQMLQDWGWTGWLFAVGLLLADIVLPIPATGVMAALGIVYGPVVGGLVGSLGSVLAGLTGYWLCRLFGRGAAVFIAGEGSMARSDNFFAKWGGFAVVVSRWVPILPEAVSCLAGLSRMPNLRFTVALICGSVPVAFTFAVLGHLGREHPTLTLAVSIAGPILLWLLVRPLVKRKGATNKAAPKESV